MVMKQAEINTGFFLGPLIANKTNVRLMFLTILNACKGTPVCLMDETNYRAE